MRCCRCTMRAAVSVLAPLSTGRPSNQGREQSLYGWGVKPANGANGLAVHSQTCPQTNPCCALAAIHSASVGRRGPAQRHQAWAS